MSAVLEDAIQDVAAAVDELIEIVKSQVVGSLNAPENCGLRDRLVGYEKTVDFLQHCYDTEDEED